MRKMFLIIMTILLFNISLVYAHEHNFTETKQLIDSGISCDKLTDEQFEAIGDYYMEQMHPGAAHDLMHQMMGGEDSESVRLMHIQMAKTLYCGESSGMMGSGGMMEMMPMMMRMMGGYYPDYYTSYNTILILAVVGWILFVVSFLILILAFTGKLKRQKGRR